MRINKVLRFIYGFKNSTGKNVSRQRVSKVTKKLNKQTVNKQKASLRNVFRHKKRGNSRNALFTMCADVCETWRYAFIMMSEFAAAATRCNERENCSFCGGHPRLPALRRSPLGRLPMTHIVPRTRRFE